MDPRQQLHEERQREADRLALEQDQAARQDAGVQAPGYVHGVDPEHGEPVVFVPGELLPEWAAKALADQQPSPDAQGNYRLEEPAKRKGAKA